jgi:hypothetical protein
MDFIRYLIRRQVSQTKGLKTSKQLADLQDKRNALLRLLQNWCEAQLVYTPQIVSLLSRVQPPDTTSSTTSSSLLPETLPENIPLFLPSLLPAHMRALPELKEVCQLERRLREPQADDALAEVRCQRRVIQGLWLFKRLNISGTGNRPNTRMITLYKRFSNKTDRAAERYKSAWRSLSALDPGGSWSTRFRELKKEHISGPGRDPEDASTTNSRYEPSWIWLVPRVSGPTVAETIIGEDEFNETMRVEWSKVRARMRRWNEELLIIQEEMRRVIVYQQWKAAWWSERSSLRDHPDVSILSGVSGYAHKQASISLCLAERCGVYWLPHLKGKGITPPWASDFEHLVDQVAVDVDVTNDGEGLEDIQFDGSGEDCEGDVEHEDIEEDAHDGANLDEDADDFDFDD